MLQLKYITNTVLFNDDLLYFDSSNKLFVLSQRCFHVMGCHKGIFDNTVISSLIRPLSPKGHPLIMPDFRYTDSLHGKAPVLLPNKTSKFCSFYLELFKNKFTILIWTSKFKFSFRGLPMRLYLSAKLFPSRDTTPLIRPLAPKATLLIRLDFRYTEIVKFY